MEGTVKTSTGTWLAVLCSFVLATAYVTPATPRAQGGRFNAARAVEGKPAELSKVAPVIDALRRRAGRVPTPQIADPTMLADLRKADSPSGSWTDTGCVSRNEMRAMVDEYLATPDPNFFPAFGPTIPAMSVAWSAPGCGTFIYAAGLRNVEKHLRISPGTPMGLASMSKAVIAAVALQLSDRGVFGPRGVDTSVGELLSPAKVRALTVGDDPSAPHCPGTTFLYNRGTGQFELAPFDCPDLFHVTLRNLMLSNHGMYDFLNEVALPDGNFQFDESVFYSLYKYLGIDAVPPVSGRNGFEYLKAAGLKRDGGATIGGTRGRDFEASLGNTGFQLLGVVLEDVTGKSLDALIEQFVVQPLRIDPIFLQLGTEPRENTIANGYEVTTGDPLFEQSGVYPLTDLHGHTAVNNAVLGLGKPANLNFAGGAGGLVATMPSYRAFFDGFVNGGLLSPAAQSVLDASFVSIPDFDSPGVTVRVGFALVNLKNTGLPGVPDSQIIFHDGSLEGIRCFNAVVREHDSNRTFAVGAMCQNSHGSGVPSIVDLWLQFITRIAQARE
jgi:hypothetical protein